MHLCMAQSPFWLTHKQPAFVMCWFSWVRSATHPSACISNSLQKVCAQEGLVHFSSLVLLHWATPKINALNCGPSLIVMHIGWPAAASIACSHCCNDCHCVTPAVQHQTWSRLLMQKTGRRLAASHCCTQEKAADKRASAPASDSSQCRSFCPWPEWTGCSNPCVRYSSHPAMWSN